MTLILCIGSDLRRIYADVQTIRSSVEQEEFRRYEELTSISNVWKRERQFNAAVIIQLADAICTCRLSRAVTVCFDRWRSKGQNVRFRQVRNRAIDLMDRCQCRQTLRNAWSVWRREMVDKSRRNSVAAACFRAKQAQTCRQCIWQWRYYLQVSRAEVFRNRATDSRVKSWRQCIRLVGNQIRFERLRAGFECWIAALNAHKQFLHLSVSSMIVARCMRTD